MTLYDLPFEKGITHGLAPFGMRAIDALRLEKSNHSWNLDLSSEYSPIASGKERFIAIDKGEFQGRAELAKQQSAGARVKMAALEIVDYDEQPISDAPVFNASGMVGRITSGDDGHTLKKVIALAYIDIVNSPEELKTEILGQRHRASIIADSPYDPGSLVQG